jgi:hypothetical protein
VLLASWDETENFVAKRYVVAERGGRHLGLRWTFPAESGDGEPTSQWSEVTLVEGFGRAFVRIISVIAGQHDLDAAGLLRRNYELLIGSIALVGQLLVVRHAIVLPAAPEELDVAIRFVPHEAARLRHLHGTQAVGHPVFAEFAD